MMYAAVTCHAAQQASLVLLRMETIAAQQMTATCGKKSTPESGASKCTRRLRRMVGGVVGGAAACEHARVSAIVHSACDCALRIFFLLTVVALVVLAVAFSAAGLTPESMALMAKVQFSTPK